MKNILILLCSILGLSGCSSDIASMGHKTIGHNVVDGKNE